MPQHFALGLHFLCYGPVAGCFTGAKVDEIRPFVDCVSVSVYRPLSTQDEFDWDVEKPGDGVRVVQVVAVPVVGPIGEEANRADWVCFKPLNLTLSPFQNGLQARNGLRKLASWHFAVPSFGGPGVRNVVDSNHPEPQAYSGS